VIDSASVEKLYFDLSQLEYIVSTSAAAFSNNAEPLRQMLSTVEDTVAAVARGHATDPKEQVGPASIHHKYIMSAGVTSLSNTFISS